MMPSCHFLPSLGQNLLQTGHGVLKTPNHSQDTEKGNTVASEKQGGGGEKPATLGLMSVPCKWHLFQRQQYITLQCSQVWKPYKSILEAGQFCMMVQTLLPLGDKVDFEQCSMLSLGGVSNHSTVCLKSGGSTARKERYSGLRQEGVLDVSANVGVHACILCHRGSLRHHWSTRNIDLY